MKETRFLLGMPITVEIVETALSAESPGHLIHIINLVYTFFEYVDETFSPFKAASEVSRINRLELAPEDACADMQEILYLAEQTRLETDGCFNIMHDNVFNPSGIVKGWSIQRAANLIRAAGLDNFYVDAGGDVAVSGLNAQGEKWRIGIRNPFEPDAIVKQLALTDCGIATSGLYNRGQHIYNPNSAETQPNPIASITVIAPTILDADRMATPAFVMGSDGIHFIESLPGFEGYQIDENGIATMTTGFTNFLPISQEELLLGGNALPKFVDSL